MCAKVATLIRWMRSKLALAIMDKRDRDVIHELTAIVDTIARKLGWGFIHDVHYRNSPVVCEEEVVQFSKIH